VSIDVDLSRSAAKRRISGRIIAQEKVTHDITRLQVQLDQALAYKAGQFANLSVASLPGVARSYSFGTPVGANSQVSFFVRKVPGGEFSSRINDQDMLGQAVQLEGPFGEFWLRPDSAPLLFVAGGSGLAPILAILQEAAVAGVARPVTLLFGAREQKDLYALAEIEAIAQKWRGSFRFVPVLSDAADDATWTGERGLVTEKISELTEAGTHAYLCGPPPMIDAALVLLEERGVPHEHVHFDRFTTQYDAPPVMVSSQPDAVLEARPSASAWDYLKFSAFHVVGLLSAAGIVMGGKLFTLGFLAIIALYMLGDAFAGDDTSTPHFRHPRILTAQLWLALPLLALVVFSAVWSVSPGDALGFGAWISGLIGHDVLAARDAATLGQHVVTWVLTGLMIGMLGTITAHELTHRTWDPISMWIGRWLLAFSFDTVFAIEHVYGHHRYVSTVEDPATAPRGRNVYFHIVASTIKGNVSAWKIEAERLQKKRFGLYSLRNAVIRGHLMSVALVVAAFAIGGWRGAAFFVVCAIWGKSLLEIVNYMEHYGMVRNPETPVQPRHSWNTNRRVSSWTMFNLTRHSHHHAQGEVPYQDLRPYPDAPMMISGYLNTIVVAMIPPLWHKLMTPKVLAWDRDFATDEERVLAARANARSGIRALREAADPANARLERYRRTAPLA
jgi:NAD(P)H-flavin reductase